MRVAKVKQSVFGHRTMVRGTKMEIVLQNLNNPTWTDDEYYDRCFQCFDNLAEFETYIMKKENIWVIYELEEEFSGNQQERYEDFVCGYLQYHDLQVIKGKTNHTIYFHWGNLKKDSKYCVTVFISPAPEQLAERASGNHKYNNEIDPPTLVFNSNPPKPPPPPPPY
jgi:hypothetical protein